MAKAGFVFALALSVAACATVAPNEPAKMSAADQAVELNRKNADHVHELLAEWKSGADKSCAATAIQSAHDFVTIIMPTVEQAYYAKSQDSQQAELVKMMALKEFIQLAQIDAPTSLDVADAYLAAGCLDQADELYRRVQHTYVGDAFDAYRQRATTGIDDVRSKRTGT